MTVPLGPSTTIGILGSGQLGRMLGLVARRMGFRVGCYGGDRHTPCGQICDFTFNDQIDNEDALKQFAAKCDVVTYEFENIPAATAAHIESLTPLHPNSDLLATAQNRLLEKRTLQKIGIPTADFREIRSPEELENFKTEFGPNPILKTTTDGYDGKGQWTIAKDSDCRAIWDQNSLETTILEQRIEFEFELSVIGGRFPDGTCRLFRPSMNDHKNHILDVSLSANGLLDSRTESEAQNICEALLDHFKVVGVLCVELFLSKNGELIVNEIAPRPHNSGHLTIEAANCSQFEMQLRTICNHPPGPLEFAPAAAMVNLLGQHLPKDRKTTQLPTELYLHDYGKREAREDRKMGHLTATGNDIRQVEKRARDARDRLSRP